MAKFLESIELSGVAIDSRNASGLVAHFYSGGNPEGPATAAPAFNKLNKHNHLSQKRLFSARLRAVTPQTKDWKSLIAAQARPTARRKPPLSN